MYLIITGLDAGEDIDHDILRGLYDRIKVCEFKPGADHVAQVMKVEQMIVGKKPSNGVSRGAAAEWLGSLFLKWHEDIVSRRLGCQQILDDE